MPQVLGEIAGAVLHEVTEGTGLLMDGQVRIEGDPVNAVPVEANAIPGIQSPGFDDLEI
jgi:hypothetical protein